MCEVVSIGFGGLALAIFIAEVVNRFAAWWNRSWTDI